jgi:hypothetical protein
MVVKMANKKVTHPRSAASWTNVCEENMQDAKVMDMEWNQEKQCAHQVVILKRNRTSVKLAY